MPSVFRDFQALKMAPTSGIIWALFALYARWKLGWQYLQG